MFHIVHKLILFMQMYDSSVALLEVEIDLVLLCPPMEWTSAEGRPHVCVA